MKAPAFFVFLALLSTQLYAEETSAFSAALKDTASYLEGRIPAKTKLVVLPILSKNAASFIGNYIADYLSAHLVNTGKFTVVDRNNQEVIQQELAFQTSGEVDNKTAAAIGHKLGAQTIILGSWEGENLKRLAIRALDVERAGVLAMKNTFIKEDAVLRALEGGNNFVRLGTTLEKGLEDAAAYAADHVPAGMKIVVMLNTNEEALAAYSADRLMEFLVNNKNRYTVVERQNLEDLRRERNFQYSGEVNDKTAVDIGKLLGAQCIVLGSFKHMGELFLFNIRAIEVETAALLGLENYIVHKNPMMMGLLAKGTWEPWKHKRLYLGARAGGSWHFYKLNTNQDTALTSPLVFEAALTADLRLSSHISLAGEFGYTYDYFRAEAAFFNTEVRAQSCFVPLFFKTAFYPQNFYLSGFAGPYIRIPLGPLELDYGGVEEEHSFSPVPGAAIGFEAGLHAGPGIIALDLRYAQNLFFTSANGEKQYRAGAFVFSLSYRTGFFWTDY
jgi:TolB-like protein